MSSATHQRQQLPLPPHRINRMPSVNDLVTAKSLQSPLTQLRVGVESRKDEAVRTATGTRRIEGKTDEIVSIADFQQTTTALQIHTLECVRLELKCTSTSITRYRIQSIQDRLRVFCRLGFVNVDSDHR
jgi:hypothetical protein